MTGMRQKITPMASNAPQRSAKPYAILLVSMLAAMFDGFDGQMIGFLAPAIGKDWSLPRSEFGAIFSIGLVGLIIGAVILAPLADRIGRRRVAIIGAVLVAAFTIATSFAGNPTQLAVLRMMTGIGLGTLMPILVTIAHEAAPPRRNGLFVTLLVTAFPFGSFLGAMVVAAALEEHGWRPIFMGSGLLACLFPILFGLFLWPSPGSSDPAEAQPVGRANVGHLFRDGWWLPTILLWTLFFASLLNTYTLGAWMPLLFERDGMATATAVRVTAGYGLGGTIGGLVLGLAATRFGGPILTAAYAIAAACLIAIGLSSGALAVLAILVTVVGAMIPGGHVGNNVLAARIYPPRMNATGVGWAQGLGRVGCVVGPAAVGLAVGAKVENAMIFAGTGALALIGAASAFGIARFERRAT